MSSQRLLIAREHCSPQTCRNLTTLSLTFWTIERCQFYLYFNKTFSYFLHRILNWISKYIRIEKPYVIICIFHQWPGNLIQTYRVAFANPKNWHNLWFWDKFETSETNMYNCNFNSLWQEFLRLVNLMINTIEGKIQLISRKCRILKHNQLGEKSHWFILFL